MFVLKQLRRKKSINQTDLALAIGVSLRTIQLYEKKNANIPIKNLNKIADYFELSIAELYTDEVNEKDGVYHTTKMTSKGDLSRAKLLGPNKDIISAPLVSVMMQSEYIQKHDSLDFLKELAHIHFVIETAEMENYISFEVIGNSMEDGSIHSIPNQAIVLGKEIDIENHSKILILKDKVVVLVYNDSLLCKKIMNYDEKRGIITCHSLNTSPEYADFEVSLVEVNCLFEVIKKQMG